MSPPQSPIAAAQTSSAGATSDRPALTRLEAYLTGSAVLFVLCFAWLVRDYNVDDAFIGFQYLKSLLAGHGFVFFAGDAPVEGVTNIGWQLVMAPFALFADPPVVAKVLGLVLALTALRLVALIGGIIAEPSGPAERRGDLWLVPVLLLASSFDFLYFAFAGMETALLAVLLLIMARRAVRDPASWELPALGCAAFLVHPEAILVAPLYLAIGLSGEFGHRRRLLSAIGILAGLVLAVTALRYGYFGDVLPNTFHAKTTGLFVKIDGAFKFLSGQNVNIAFPITGVAVLPVLAFGYFAVRRRSASLAAMLAAITTTGIAFGIYSRADWTEHARYFAPYIPAALILFWCGLTEIIGQIGAPRHRVWKQRILVVALAALLATQFYGMLVGMAQMKSYPGYVLAGRTLIPPAEWIRDNLPEDATVATRRIGALAYYSDRRVFDYVFGLTERDVAALAAERNTRLDATDPELAELWAARAPDYILEDEDRIDQIIEAAGGTPERFVVHGIGYRVVRRFQIGSDAQWVLAGRNDLP